MQMFDSDLSFSNSINERVVGEMFPKTFQGRNRGDAL